MHDKQLIEKLVYDIASRFDTSINLAEAQAVVGASPAEDLEWLCDCFEEIGLDDWHNYVRQDPRFFRPAEVDLLIGDPTKAREKLGWVPEVDFKSLVSMMVQNDLAIESARARK